MTLTDCQLLPCIDLQLLIDLAVYYLQDKNYEYSAYRLNKLEDQITTLWYQVNEECVRP